MNQKSTNIVMISILSGSYPYSYWIKDDTCPWSDFDWTFARSNKLTRHKWKHTVVKVIFAQELYQRRIILHFMYEDRMDCENMFIKKTFENIRRYISLAQPLFTLYNWLFLIILKSLQCS